MAVVLIWRKDKADIFCFYLTFGNCYLYLQWPREDAYIYPMPCIWIDCMTFVFTSYISLSLKTGCLSGRKSIDLRSISDNPEFITITFFCLCCYRPTSKINYINLNFDKWFQFEQCFKNVQIIKGTVNDNLYNSSQMKDALEKRGNIFLLLSSVITIIRHYIEID